MSLKAQLNDVTVPGKTHEYTMGSPKAYSVRTQKYRYTEWRKDKIHADYSMLYDLENDPNEYENLVGNYQYKEIEVELKRKLDSVLIN